MTSQCYSTLSVILTFGMAVLLEFGKSYFFTKSINGKGYTRIMRSTFLIVSIFLFVYSIVASLSFLANETTKMTEPNKITANEITKKQDEVKAKEIVLKDKKAVLEDYEKTSQQSIQELKDNINKLPKDYIDYTRGMDYNDVVRTESDRITQMTSDRSKEIDKRNTEIEKLTTEATTLKNSIKLNATDKAGYTAFVKQITDKLNKGKKTNLWTVDEVMSILLSGLSILFEIVAVLLYYSASTERRNSEGSTKDTTTLEYVEPLEIAIEDKKIYTSDEEKYAFAKYDTSLEVPKVKDDYKRSNIGFKHDSQDDKTCAFDTRRDLDNNQDCKNENTSAKISINTKKSDLKVVETPIRTKYTEDHEINNTDFKPISEIQNSCTFDTCKADTDYIINKNDSNVVLKSGTGIEDGLTFDTRKTDDDLNSNMILKDVHFEVTREKIEKYINFIKSCTLDGNVCPSNASVAKSTNLKYSEIRTIKNILKANRVIDVDEQKKRTILLRVPDRNEVDSWGWQ